MKRQRNTTQMKEQTRNTEFQINEEEIGKLPEKEFRIMIVKVIKNLENKMEKMQESMNKDLEELKNKHTEKNNTIAEIKNILEGINSRISEAEEWISELEDKMVEITSEEQNKVKRMKITEDSLRILWDNIKCISIWSKGSQKKKKGYETHIDWKWEDGKNISQANGKQKKAGVAILISDKIDLNIKKITIDKEEHYIMIKGSIQEEDITIVNIYAPNIEAPQYIGLTLTDIKGEIDSNTINSRRP